MTGEEPLYYDFGPYRLDVRGRKLLHSAGPEPLKLQPVEFDVLLTLVRNRGRVVTRQELSKKVWRDELNWQPLFNTIHRLRQILSDRPRHQPYIVTERLVGYLFAHAVDAVRSQHPGAAGLLRSEKRALSRDDAKIMISDRNFYCANWNESGTGIEHRYEPRTLERALVVVDHATELMWEKDVEVFVRWAGRTPEETQNRPEARIGELNAKNFAGVP
jgi:DNA-binding winged helix-turn-helix (wHTH) protein